MVLNVSKERDIHDYSSGRRGAVIGRKSITIKLKRRGAPDEVGKEVRKVTVKRAAAATEFVFDAYNPPWDMNEISPVLSEYAEGANVYCKYAVKNIGGTAGGATIKVKDLDTGTTVATYSVPTLDPNYRYRTTGSHAYVGKMPSRDWRLEWTVTP